MTKLILDPEAIPILCPKASYAFPQKFRIVAQVHHYDHTSALLLVGRLPNIAALVTEIDLDSSGDIKRPAASVDVSRIIQVLSSEHTTTGVAVSILGFYNGASITAVECTAIDAQVLIGDSSGVLVAMATLKDI